MDDLDIARKAYSYATQKHKDVNHFYDNKSYDVHLWMVHDIAKMFMHYIPDSHRDIVLAGCWLHDTIEDCRVTYNDIKQEFGYHVAEIVYALTNEKGRNRSERANEKYYQGIKAVRFADFIKLCDRAANIKYSLENKSSMLSKYHKEHPDFVKTLQGEEYLGLWEYIASLLSKA